MPDASNSNQFSPLAPYSVGTDELFAELGQLLDPGSVRLLGSPNILFFPNGVRLYIVRRIIRCAGGRIWLGIYTP